MSTAAAADRRMAQDSSAVVAPAALGTFLLLAGYLNLNDPDWTLWSTSYTIGAAICCWTVVQGSSGRKYIRKDSSSIRRSIATTYGAACLGLAAHSAFLAERGDTPQNADGVIVSFLSSEVAREAGGALIMAFAMALCAAAGPSSTGGSATVGLSAGGAAVKVVSVAVAIAAILMGLYLPGYLQRAGVAVPAHCGGGDL